MDLIYMNPDRQDIGVLHDYKLDLAFGKDENNFELQIPSNTHCCSDGFYLYVEDTEYGGVVDSIRSDTAQQEVAYIGRTWHGMLNSKIIAPDPGEDYLVLNGDANSVLLSVIQRLGLTDLFTASGSVSGLAIAGYKMPRYIPAYDGIRKMLGAVSGKLAITFSKGYVVLAAVPRADHSDLSELDSDKIGFRAQRNYRPVNHLICLGRGELAARDVVHLYVDETGNISKTQTLIGLQERTEVYDYPNAESLEELEAGGVERLKELAVAGDIKVNLGANGAVYDVQDTVAAVDNVTGLFVTAEISKKIVTIDRGEVEISYEVEE